MMLKALLLPALVSAFTAEDANKAFLLSGTFSDDLASAGLLLHQVCHLQWALLSPHSYSH